MQLCCCNVSLHAPLTGRAQNAGILTAAAVGLIVTYIFQAFSPGGPYGHSVDMIKNSVSDNADYVWRIQVRCCACARLLLHDPRTAD